MGDGAHHPSSEIGTRLRRVLRGPNDPRWQSVSVVLLNDVDVHVDAGVGPRHAGEGLEHAPAAAGFGERAVAVEDTGLGFPVAGDFEFVELDASEGAGGADVRACFEAGGGNGDGPSVDFL